jgi:aspartate/methionine/tyrosine aminotransferase
MTRIDVFEMERMQSLHWHEVELDLSESGVAPLRLDELAGEHLDAIVRTPLGYPLSEGSAETRERVAAWYPGATVDGVTIVNGGSEANHLSLWSLLEPGDRLAFGVPNYLQGAGLGRVFGEATDPFRLVRDGDAWALDLDSLDAAVGPKTKVVMVCHPNNPTGYVLSGDEMDGVVAAAERVGAWIVADEIYRGADVATDETTPTFWGRSERVVVTSGLSKAFGLPGLRLGWAVAPPSFIRELWVRHDYTTLTPGMLSDRLAAIALEPVRREALLARTRAIIRANLPEVRSWAASRPRIRFAPPDAGAIAYLELEPSVDTRALAERLRVEQSVLVVPAEMFGLASAMRIGFGGDPEELREGLERVASVVDGG